MATVPIDESYYLNNNSTSATNMEEFRLTGPELPMAATKPFQLPLHVRAWVWLVVVVGFTLLSFYFGGYYRYWRGRKASLSRLPLPYHFSSLANADIRP